MCGVSWSSQNDHVPTAMRRWTDEETGVLQNHIDTHLGHCDGLKGVYWKELSLSLERVRKDGDAVLRKPQVTNKIVAFRRREVPCSYILEHGTCEEQASIPKKYKKRLSSKAGPTKKMAVDDTFFAPDGTIMDEHPGPAQTDTMKNNRERKAIRDTSAFTYSSEPEYDHENMVDLRAPLHPEPHGQPLPCTSLGPQSASCEGLDRNSTSEAFLESTVFKRSSRKSRRAKRKRARYEEHCQEESNTKDHAVDGPVREGLEPNVELSDRVYGQELELAARQDGSFGKSFGSNVVDFADIEQPPWQDMMLQSWQNHLAYQDCIRLIQEEPTSHREVSCTMEELLKYVTGASISMQKMFPHHLSLSNFGPSLAQILSVLTGCKTQRETEDVLQISQSLTPLSTRANVFDALLGATIYQWVYEDFLPVAPCTQGYDPVRMVLDQFLERERPELWMSYKNLYRHQLLSSYTNGRIASEAGKLARDAYVLLSTAYLSSDSIHDSQTHRATSTTAFEVQTQHYQAFKASMTEAYRLALELRISFAKCSDLVYEFQFPKTRDKFDASCMEVRKSATDDGDNVVGDHDQLVATGLLPSIWSRKRNENDPKKVNSLVTKAIVLL